MSLIYHITICRPWGICYHSYRLRKTSLHCGLDYVYFLTIFFAFILIYHILWKENMLPWFQQKSLDMVSVVFNVWWFLLHYWVGVNWEIPMQRFWGWVERYTLQWMMFAIYFLFLIILLIGLYHDWNQGSLEWAS